MGFKILLILGRILMKIAIEGMDGSGKTTLAKAFANQYNFKYVEKPFKFLFNGLNLSDADIKQIEWKLYETEDESLISMFYGMGLLYGTRHIADENVVYDRHLVSNYYWHGNEETEYLHNLFINYCGKPDLTILLKASVETRMGRIASRDGMDQDLSNSAMYDYGYDKMEKYLIDHNFTYVNIDTDNLTAEEVFVEVSRIINEFSQTQKISRKL